MNKKLIVISMSVVAIIAIVIGVIYFINQTNSSKPTSGTNSKNSSNYYVEKGAEEMAKVIKPAVENYLAQDITESTAARKSRLSAYFSPDSPVFNRDIEIRSTNTATKTTAKVTSVTFHEGEAIYPSLIVKTDVTSYSGVNQSTSSQTYWITIKKNADGSYMAYDIGIMVE